MFKRATVRTQPQELEELDMYLSIISCIYIYIRMYVYMYYQILSCICSVLSITNILDILNILNILNIFNHMRLRLRLRLRWTTLHPNARFSADGF